MIRHPILPRFTRAAMTLCLLSSSWCTLAAAEAQPTDSNAITEEAVADTDLRFEVQQLRYYNYISTQQVTQKINDDTISTSSELAWNYALRCTASNQQGADLTATIQIIRAHITDPAHSHRIDSSNHTPPHPDNVLRHLLLLNGKTLRIHYDYTSQSIDRVTGGAAIIAAIRSRYPADDFGDDQRITLQAAQQFSDASLLRLWGSLFHGARATNDSDAITLDKPLQRQITRTWSAPKRDGAHQTHPYTLELTEPTAALESATIANAGPNAIHVRLHTLSGSGSITISDHSVHASTQTITAELVYHALTQEVTQHMTLIWKMAEVPAPALASPLQQQGVTPLTPHTRRTD